MKNLQAAVLSGHEIIDQYLVSQTSPLRLIRDERLPKQCYNEVFIVILDWFLDDEMSDENFHEIIEAHYPDPEKFQGHNPNYINGLVGLGLRRGIWLDYCKQELKAVSMISYHDYKDYIDMLARHGLEHLKELDDYKVPNKEYANYIKQKIKLLENPQAAYNEFSITDSPYLFA